MKYIITESKLDKVISKYLDVKLDGINLTKGITTINYDIVFKFPNEKKGVLGWDEPDSLYIFHGLVREISDLFGLDWGKSEKAISDWVEDNFNLKVNNTSITYVPCH